MYVYLLKQKRQQKENNTTNKQSKQFQAFRKGKKIKDYNYIRKHQHSKELVNEIRTWSDIHLIR